VDTLQSNLRARFSSTWIDCCGVINEQQSIVVHRSLKMNVPDSDPTDHVVGIGHKVQQVKTVLAHDSGRLKPSALIQPETVLAGIYVDPGYVV
jgi:hypothetical protein